MVKKNLIIWLFLSFWVMILYDICVVDFPEEYPLLRVRRELSFTGGRAETEIDFKPGYYLLKVVCDRWQAENDVWFNGNKISSFKIHEAENRSVYFYLYPEQFQQGNRLVIEMGADGPRQVIIKLQNYRHMPIRDYIVELPKAAAAGLIKFRPSQSFPVFLLSFALLAISMSQFQTAGRNCLVKLIVVLGLAFSVAVGIQTLPFVKIAFFMTPACFFIAWAGPLALGFLIIIRNAVSRQSVSLLKHGKVVFNRCKVSCENSFDEQTEQSNKRGYVVFVFFFLLLIISGLRYFIVADRRVPMGHDTFQYLQLQYTLFFNEMALNKVVPQWFPFMTHGTVSNLWLTFSQGIFVSVIAPVAGLFKQVNFYSIFQAGLLLDEIILLFGCIALAKRYFRSIATTLFVTSSILFTTISSTQIWWDFHLLYLFPITLYCFDRAVRENSAKYLFYACLFLVGMMLGNPPYCAPLFVFFLCVFGISVWLYFPKETSACLKQFIRCFKRRHVLAILLPCMMLLLIFSFIQYGTADIVTHNSKRAENWQVSGLKEFLNYGGNINLSKYFEMIFRGTNNLDNTIYAGLLIVPFITLTFLRVRSRMSYVFGTTALIMVLFSAGIVIPVIFYYVFPLARYYRHIGLIAPLAKLFIVFYAAFGFERFWQLLKCLRLPNHNASCLAEVRSTLTVLILATLVIFGLVSFQWITGSRIYDFPGSTGNFKTMNLLYADESQISYLLFHLVLLSSGFLIIFLAMTRLPRKTAFLGWLLIAMHLVDVVSFKAENEIKRLPKVDQQVVDLFDVYDYSFSESRSQNYLSDDRFCALAPYLFFEYQKPFDPERPAEMFTKYGVQYWNLDTFLFYDAVSHVFSTQRWLKGVDAFYQAWVPASERAPSHAGFPIPESEAFRKLCGWSYGKVQLFSRIHVLPNEESISAALSESEFKGDMIFMSDSELERSEGGKPLCIDADGDISLIHDERIKDSSIYITEFTSNTLRLQVSNSAESDAVLYYADSWHPEWKAYVNGKSSPVIKTNIAYKSVIIPPGKSEVVFRFGDKVSLFLFNGMIGIGIVVFLGFCCCLFTGLFEKDRNFER